MWSLILCLAEWKKPPQRATIAQFWHSEWYSFFQSLMDLTANGQSAPLHQAELVVVDHGGYPASSRSSAASVSAVA